MTPKSLGFVTDTSIGFERAEAAFAVCLEPPP